MTVSTEPEESGALGSKLRRVVHSVLARRDPPRASSDSLAQNVPRPDPPSTCSDTSDDIFSDKQIVTAVEALSNGTIHGGGPDHGEDSAVQPYGSAGEPQRLAGALCRKLALGAFSRRLRVRAPPPGAARSLPRVVLLQSGDGASLLLDSDLSRNFKTHASKSSDTVLPVLPLATTHVDFRFSRLPVQVATVGYAFPRYERRTAFATRREERNDDVDATVPQTASGSSRATGDAHATENKTCQCFKGVPETARLECAVQADLSVPAAPRADPDRGPNRESVDTVSENKAETYASVETEITKLTPERSAASVVLSKETEQKSDEAMQCETLEEKTEIIDYTTSLDMLVNLLTEIQNITAGIDDTSNGEDCGSEERNDSPKTVDSGSSSMAPYVNYTDAHKDKVEMPVPETKTVSATAVAPECASKEVSAQFPDAQDRQHASVLTEAPSRLHLFPGVVGTDSFLDSMLSCPSSSRSVLALSDSPARLNSQPSIACTDRALQVMGTKSVSVKSLVMFHDKNNAAVRMKEQGLICKKLVNNALLKSEIKYADDVLMKRVVLFEKTPQKAKILNKCCLNATEFDPVMKMKRDILVTVYSLLMLTVFAALSFPELLHQT